MNPSMKVWLIVLIGLCFVFYQYHLSTSVRFEQVTDFNTGESQVAFASGNVQSVENLENYAGRKITEETIRSAVDAVQKTYGLSPDLGNSLFQELVHQFNKTTVSGVKNGILNGGKINGSSNEKTKSTNDTTRFLLPYQRTNSPLEPLYIITPTFRRPEQIPELTRMAHTLMLVENVHWLVIEDAKSSTPQVTKFLNRTGLAFEHLVGNTKTYSSFKQFERGRPKRGPVREEYLIYSSRLYSFFDEISAPMPDKYKQKKGAKPRGVSNRNRGLEWLRANATKGVFYFADDDNTYDIDLFDEIRRTKKVSMFPVGLCTKYGMSSPIVKNGKFTGFYDGWIAGRKFPVDMAGFAVSVTFLLTRPNATMPYKAGFEEDGFLKSLAPLEPREVELLADNCTRILAWHTQTKRNEPSAPLNMKLHRSTNLVELKQQIV